MLRSRIIIALLGLALAAPSTALAQGAGDDQYQDPFPEERAQNTQDDGGGGLTDEPPVPDTPDDPAPTDDPAPVDPPQDETATLPNTGSEPLMLAYVGILFVLVGIGLRLRTLDPDSY